MTLSKISSGFVQYFMELDMIKYLDLKTVYIWGLGPKTSLGQSETKAFGKRRIML